MAAQMDETSLFSGEEEKKEDDTTIIESDNILEFKSRVDNTDTRPTENISMGPSFWIILRTVVLDLPLILIVLVYAAMVWVHHVHDAYLEPQMRLMDWTDERMTHEITYYERSCTLEDMTTFDGGELFLPLDATPADAYEHQLEHGFTVFRSVLSPEVARDLRTFVDEKNRKLSALEKIFVIEGENRFSFGLGTEEPTVSRAMKELAHHPLLRPSLEKIIGANPALIEMTAITASSGAVAQWWHADVISQASAARYAHTFGPAYSVFIPLQNTTKEMGATAGCPGTHMCSAGPMEIYCEEHGFQIVGEDGYWGAGDALLMNMNSWHRGGAHIDPDAEDRVMLILTFSPRIEPRAESRQMSQGITYSLRWDMWGHTLYDLADADKRMAQPWATLRALGLYKPKEADWGVDYVTGTCMRLVNDYNFFVAEDLVNFVKEGGMNFIPSFLRAEADPDGKDEEAWHNYLLETFLNCKRFVAMVAGLGSFVFVLAYSICNMKSGGGASSSMLGSIRRLVAIISLVCLVEKVAERKIDESDWAVDVRGNRRFSSVFGNDDDFGIHHRGPTTLPNRNDVLFDNRYEDSKLAIYTDFARGNPGHRQFLEVAETVAPFFLTYPHNLKRATAAYVRDTVEQNSGRFLGQGPQGNWYLMSESDSSKYVMRQLTARSTPVIGVLQKEIRSLKGFYRFGILRDTAMGKKSYKYLETLNDGVFGYESLPVGGVIEKKPRAVSFFGFAIPDIPVTCDLDYRSHRYAVEPAQPPTSTAWIKEGDLVEGAVDGYWYPGWVRLVDAHRMYHIDYPDGDSSVSDELEVRVLMPFYPGESADVGIDDFDWTPCVIVAVRDDGSCDVEVVETGVIVENVAAEYLRRRYVRQGYLFAFKSAYWG